MTAKLAKIALSITVGMFGLVLVMSMLAGAGPAAVVEDIGENGGSALVAGAPSDVLMDVSPGEIRADGESNSTITGTVRGAAPGCSPVQGAFLAFTTSLGAINQICYGEAENVSVTKLPTDDDWETVASTLASGGYFVKSCGTSHPNAALSWTFTATAISMLYIEDPEGGVVEVQVDGNTAITVDMYAATRVAAERVITAGLGSGSHTVTVEYLTKSPVGGGTCIRIDAFRCGATTDENGQATATLTSTVLSCGSENATVTALTGDPNADPNDPIPYLRPYMRINTELVQFTASVPYSVEVTATPNQIVADGASTSDLEAVLLDQFGEDVPDYTMVGFDVTDEDSAAPGEAWAVLPYELVEGEDPTEVITDGWSIDPDVSHHDGQAIYTNTMGATASWTFTGTAVSLIYPKLSDAGVATVTVGSGSPITIDMYAPSPGQYQVEHVITDTLIFGSHVITVEVAGYTLGGTDKRVYVDAFRSGTSTSGSEATAVLTAGTQAGVVWVEAAGVGRQCCEMDSVVTDTVPITLTAGDPYTLTITPADVPITCCNTSTLQFTVTDVYSNVVGAVVSRPLTVSFTSTPYGIFTPTNPIVITDGVGSVEFHGWTEGIGAITGTVEGYGVTGTSNLTVAAASCNTLTISPGHREWLYVTDTNIYLLPDFPYTTTITATLRDSCDNAVQNDTVVTFTTSLGNLSPLTQTTINGIATAVLTSENLPAGVLTQTAYITVTGASCPVSDTASIDFVRHVYTLTVGAVPDEMPVGANLSTLTAVVTDGVGSPVLNGVRVSFTTIPTPTDMVSVPGGYEETVDGTATSTATSGTQAGVVTIEAEAVGTTVTNTRLITITAGDPYTLTITPASVSITCCVTDTLQFTVTDVYSNVVGAVVSRPLTVSFTSTPYGDFTPPSVVITDGVGSVEFHGYEAGTGAITGTVQVYGVVGTAALTVTPSACDTLVVDTDRTWLYVTDTNIYLLPDFPYTTTITATLGDSCGNAVQNDTVVTFTTSLGNLSPLTQTTINGIATAVLTSGNLPAGVPTQTAYITVTGASCPVSDTASIDFVRHVYTLTVGAVPDEMPVGANLSTLTAVVTDGVGSPVLNGVRVSFTTIPTPTDMVSVPGGYEETVDGTATSTATSGTQAGVVTIEAVATGTTVTNTRLITITAGDPYTLTITPANVSITCCVTDTLQFTVTDEYSNVVGDVVSRTLTVDFTSTPFGDFTPPSVVITDGVGSVEFHGYEAGTGAITGTVNGYPVVGTAALTVAPGACNTLVIDTDRTWLYITDTNTSLLADFPYTTTITAEMRDSCNNPVQDGTVVTFTTSLGSVGPVNPTTVNGIATAVLTSGNLPAGAPTQTAYITVTGASCPVLDTTTVDFGRHVYTVTVSANPDEMPVGGSTSDLTANVYDGFGDPTLDGIMVGFTITPSLRASVPHEYVEAEDGTEVTAPGWAIAATYISTDTVGAWASWNFTGTAVSLVYHQDPNRGEITVTIDSPSYTRVIDMSGPDAWVEKVVTTGLSFASRNVIVTVKTAGASDAEIDAFRSGATISGGAGQATAIATSGSEAGVATIEAAAIGSTITNTGLITITAGNPYTLTITPENVSITCCVTSTLQFTVTDLYNNVLGEVSSQPVVVCLYCTPSSLVDSWSPSSCVSTTNGVGSVEFHGYGQGTGTIRGYVRGFSYDAEDTSNITVTASSPASLTITREPDTILADGFDATTITATVKDSCDNPVCNSIVTFEVDSGTLDPPPSATLSITRATDCNGVAVATLTSGCIPGTTNITVTVDSLTATTYVDMVGVAGSMQLVANPTSIQVGGYTSNLTATVQDQFGNPVLDGTVVTFTTSLGDVGSDTTTKPTTNGVAEALLTSSETAGTAFISATAGSGVDAVTDMVTVTFEAGPVYTVMLEAYPTTLTVGSSSALTATVTDQYGNRVADGTVVTFTTSLGDLGGDPVTRPTVSGVATATLTSLADGTATVTARADSKSDAIDVIFQPDLPDELTLAAQPTALTVGETSTLTATVKDQYDNNVADGTSVLFETNLGSVGSLTVTKTTVNGIAVATLTSQAPGAATVVATADPVSDTVDVTFEVGPPDVLTLEADPTSILVGGVNSTLTVTVTDQFGNNLPDGTSVLFETSLGSLGSVTVTKFTADGVAVATLTSSDVAGVAMITVTVGSKVATTAVAFIPDVPDVITLVANPMALTVGETSTLTATVKDQYDNNVADGTSVLFETNLGSVGSLTVTKTTVNGIAVATLTSQVPGTATVTATADPVSDAVDVTFEVGPVHTVTLEAYPMTLTVGSTSALTVTVVDQYNNTVANGTVVTITTNLGDVGSQLVTKTTTSGVATAELTSQAPGTATVTATADSKSDTTDVIFQPDLPYTLTLVANPMALTVGETSTLTATVKDQYANNVADGTSVLFETNLGSLGSLTITKPTASGIAVATLTSQVPGTATVTATADSASDAVDVTFEAGPPYTLTLAAQPTALTVGETSTLTATVKDQYANNVADGTSVLFETNLGSLGSLTITKPTASGIAVATLTSQVPGTATVTATADSVSDDVDVTFEVGSPYTLTLVANPTSLTVGETSTLTATVKDQFNNNVADGTSVLFETNLGSLGSLAVTKPTANGIAVATLTSLLPGTAAITATADSVSDTVDVIFEVGPPDVVTLEANPTSIMVGGFTSTLTVTVTDQYGNNAPDGTSVLFETSLGSLGSVEVTKFTADGVAIATLTSSDVAGVAMITATAGSEVATTVVTFTPDAPDAITLAADPASLAVGETSTLTATVTDQYGNNVADDTDVLFETNLGSLGSLAVTKPTADGIAIATLNSQVPGRATIIATSGSVDATAVVIFTPGLPDEVTLVADPENLAVGGASALTAIVKDQYENNVADGTMVNFETNLGSVGSTTIDKPTVNGIVTATLTSQESGIATVTATSDSKYDTASVTFNPGPPFTMTVEADPMIIPIGGFTSTITATVEDQYGNPVTDGTEVIFVANLGDLDSVGVAQATLNGWVAIPPLYEAAAQVEMLAQIVKSTVNGVATATLISEQAIGTVNITVFAGLVTGATQVTFTVGAPHYIGVEASPPTIEVGGNTSTITAMVRDIGGNAVADDTPVEFTTDFGSLGSTAVTKYTINGVATAILTSELTPGTATVRATADSKFDTVLVNIVPGPPSIIDVTANPTYIPIGGVASSITAMVTDQYGNNVANGTSIDFYTTMGSISPSSDTTDNGVAETTLTSEYDTGTARVTAISGAATGLVDVVFTIGPPFYINVVAYPTSIGLDGQTSDIQATVKDIGGNYVADGTEVTFVTSLGALGSDTVVKTTTGGVAAAVLTSETFAGTAVITATAGSYYHMTNVVFNPDPPDAVTVTADPMAIPANGTSTSMIRATVTDQYGNMVADGTSCSLYATLGTVWPPFATTLNGVAETILTSGETSGLAAVTATCAGIEDTIHVFFYGYSFRLYLPVVLKEY